MHVNNRKMRLQFPMVFLLFVCFSCLYNCSETPYKQGAILYENFCESCHMKDGSGLGGEIPPLAKADYLSKYGEKVPCIIQQGISDSLMVNGKWYSQPMAGIEQLSAIEITNIINYMHTSWGNELPPVSLQEVNSWLEPCTRAEFR